MLVNSKPGPYLKSLSRQIMSYVMYPEFGIFLENISYFGNLEYMSQLLLLGKVEYGGGPIFKVVLEC